MVKGKSRPELYILLMKDLKPKRIKELMPEYSLSTIYYYSRKFKQGVGELIKRDLIDSNLKLKVKEKNG